MPEYRVTSPGPLASTGLLTSSLMSNTRPVVLRFAAMTALTTATNRQAAAAL
jgi:hypothetical protein